MDALDPDLVDSTGTRVPGGLEPEEVREIITSALEIDKLVSLDVVEFNKDLGCPENSLLSIKHVFEPDMTTEEDSDLTTT